VTSSLASMKQMATAGERLLLRAPFTTTSVRASPDTVHMLYFTTLETSKCLPAKHAPSVLVRTRNNSAPITRTHIIGSIRGNNMWFQGWLALYSLLSSTMNYAHFVILHYYDQYFGLSSLARMTTSTVSLHKRGTRVLGFGAMFVRSQWRSQRCVGGSCPCLPKK
jgi:hypothetical protein